MSKNYCNYPVSEDAATHILNFVDDASFLFATSDAAAIAFCEKWEENGYSRPSPNSLFSLETGGLDGKAIWSSE